MINVLLVDDHELVLTGLKRIIENNPGIKVIGTAKDGNIALPLVNKLQPDIVLMDLKMPGPGPIGEDLLRLFLRTNPGLKVIIITACDNETFPVRLLHAGAMGYLTKDLGSEELIRAIQMVHNGQRYIPQKIANEMALKRSSGLNRAVSDVLSVREYEIMSGLIKGYSAQEIGKQLGISHKTVNTYRYRMFEKLKITNNVELAQYAIHNGLLDPNFEFKAEE